MDKFLENNTLAKGVAIILSIMLWMIVSLDDQVGSNIRQTVGSTTLNQVKVETIYDDEMYAIMEMEDTAQVILSGRRALLNFSTIRPSYRLFVDLSHLGEGTHRVKVQHEGFPSELHVELVPSYLTVVIEKKEARSFPVQIDLIGEAQEGYTVGEPVKNEEQVHVIAPSSILDTIASVRGVVTINKANKIIQANVQLKAYDKQGNEVQAEISPNSIEVQIPVQSPSVTVPLRIQTVNQLPIGLSLIDLISRRTEVEVFAPKADISSIKQAEAILDLATITSSQTVPVAISLEEGWFATNPAQIEVEVLVGPTSERVFSNIPIQTEGLREGLELQFLDPVNGMADISILGAKNKLDTLTNEEISLSIDARRLQVGEHTLPLQINLSGNPIYFSKGQNRSNVRVQVLETEASETIAETNEEEVEGE